MKHGIIISDPHCGHLVGLTPPYFQIRPKFGGVTKRNKWYHTAIDLWHEFDKILKQLPPLDFVFSLGDHTDGKGLRSGGTELLTSDMQEQCDMAVAVFDHIRKYCKPKVKIVGVYGTPYHTDTNGDEWENIVAHRAGFDKIGSHEWVDVNGCIFDLKHHLGSSSIPHGRHTQTSKERLWNALWAEQELQPKANIILRGHVHYYQYCGGRDWLGMTMPALQGLGSKYGSKICSGTVDWGLIYFKISDNGEWEFTDFIKTIKSQRAEAIKI